MCGSFGRYNVGKGCSVASVAAAFETAGSSDRDGVRRAHAIVISLVHLSDSIIIAAEPIGSVHLQVVISHLAVALLIVLDAVTGQGINMSLIFNLKLK